MFKRFREKISASIADSDKYEVYEKNLLDYKKYLLCILQKQPGHVYASCQLGIVQMELREDSVQSIRSLKKLLKNYAGQMPASELADVYTCLAALHVMDMNQYRKAAYYLNKAVELKPTALLWEKLGLAYARQEKFYKALNCFEQAKKIAATENNCYYCALSLALLGKYDKALTSLPRVGLNNVNSAVEHLVFYLCGFCLAQTGRKEDAAKIADQLVLLDEKADERVYNMIAESEIADIYYLCEKYAKHNQMYDNSKIKYYPDASWLGCYFDSLKKLGKEQELEQKLADVKQEKLEQIASLAQEEYTEQEGGEAAKEDYRQSLEKEIAEVVKVYEQVKTGRFTSRIKCAQAFLYDCYYIDCPRHSKELL